MSTEIDEMMQHLDEEKSTSSSSDEEKCSNCQKKWRERAKKREISQTGHPTGGNSKTNQTWTNLVCPKCGKTY